MDFNFKSAVEYFSFDWVDIFDFGSNSSTQVIQYSIYADGQLIATLKGRIIGAGRRGDMGLYDANGVLKRSSGGWT